ncbi:hypothetical protein SEVIR_9G004400v4 [Setaria viridis]
MATATLLLLLVCFLAASFLAAGGGRRTVVFLLAGQSNMGGRGGATNGTWDRVVPPECAPSPRILRLSPDLHWEEAREPLHQGIDLHNVLGVGPGMPFAHAVLRSRRLPPHAAVGLVPCAQGATPITSWSRGTELYERMLARARAALSLPGGDRELAALLWYQGEADTITRRDADLYTARMEAFVRDVRRDLNMPHLLVIQVVTNRILKSRLVSISTMTMILDEMHDDRSGLPPVRASSSSSSGRLSDESSCPTSSTWTPRASPSPATTRILRPRHKCSSARC